MSLSGKRIATINTSLNSGGSFTRNSTKDTEHILSENNVCSEKYPYMKKGKNGIDSCYKDNAGNYIRAFPEVVNRSKLGDNLINYSKRIMQAQEMEDLELLDGLRKQLTRGEYANLIIYDVQATGVPEIIEPDDGSEKYVSFPAIFQFSFYHPKTGRHLTSYVMPHKPIEFEPAYQTGVYNSFSKEFTLPYLPDHCYPSELDSISMVTYRNDSLISLGRVQDIIDELRESMNGIDEESLIDLSIDKYITENDIHSTPLKSLEEDENIAMFYEYIDEIVQFLSLGESENTRTILIAHNGSRWAEPILRAEFERACASDQLDESMIFLDSKTIFMSIIKRLTDDQPTLNWIDENLGEKKQESFNTAIDVLSLWRAIEDMFNRIFDRKDWNFITSKIIEELYHQSK